MSYEIHYPGFRLINNILKKGYLYFILVFMVLKINYLKKTAKLGSVDLSRLNFVRDKSVLIAASSV